MLRSRPYPGTIFTSLALSCSATALALDVRVSNSQPSRYSTIQAGIDAVVAAGGGNVFVQSGAYFESPQLRFQNLTVNVLGGWDSTFSSQSGNPNDTLILFVNSNANGVIMDVGGTAHVEFSGFRMGGALNSGVQIYQYDNTEVRFENNIVTNNHGDGGGNEFDGGGILAKTSNSAYLRIGNTEISGNSASATGGSHAFGGGLFLQALGNSEILLTDSHVRDNAANGTSAAPTAYCHGAGVYGLTRDGAGIDLERVLVEDNTESYCALERDAPGAWLNAYDTNGAPFGISVDESVFRHNTISDPHAGSSEVRLQAANTAFLWMGNSLVTNSDDRGIYAHSFTVGAIVRLVNVTAAYNAMRGMRLDGADAEAWNSVSALNGENSSLENGAHAYYSSLDWLDPDPRFVDPANGDFHLRPDSPLIDRGNEAVPGGLSCCDIEGNPRVRGMTVDIGAYESPYSDRIFADDFE